MLKQIMTKPGEIIFENVDVPVIAEHEVLVKIIKIGICGSDIHVYHGKHPFTSYPVTQGHEVSGIVEAVGTGVVGLKKGQKVTIQPQVVCGECYPCRNGTYNLCEKLKVMGFQTEGMAATYFAVDAEKLIVLPEEMSFEEGAMIEPLAVAVHAVRKGGDVRGKDLIVLGAGPIGILVAQTAKGMGAHRVMITDISEIRLQKAMQCGIDHCLNTGKEALGPAVLKTFGPDKADLIFDCAGNNVTIGQAITYARKGSKIVLVAVFEGKAEVDLAVLNDKELDLDSSMMYRKEDYVKAIEMVCNEQVNLKPMVSASFCFQDYLAAYQYIDENREHTMKVMINVQE